MEHKCESLVRSKLVEVDAGRKEMRRLRSAEPCGSDGMLYVVVARKAKQKNRIKDDVQQTFKNVKDWSIERGSISVRMNLCDKHKRKAQREGKELIPA